MIEVSRCNKSHPNEKIIIFSHGNASDIYTFYRQLCNYSTNLGVKIICYDYPGYGLSTGNLNEENCYSAIEEVVNHYIKKVGEANIILVGQSLGTGITVNYANNHNWKYPIVLISPYKSIARVICDTCVPESSFRHNMFKTYVKIENLECPVKLIHGTNDTVIPIHHSQYLYDRLKYPMSPSWKQGVGHNDIYLELSDMENIL